MNINSHAKAVLHYFSWAVRIKITISKIGMRELFLMKEPQKFRMQDIFHQESFSEIRKKDGKLRTHSHFKDTIGIEKYIYTIKNVQERNIHSFWFISFIPLRP